MIRVSVWTAVFLVVLRVCIGWHFAYEGYGKVRSAYQGKAAVNDKPFSSEAFFRESESAFGRLVKKQLGDPDQEVLNKLTLKPEGEPVARFPDALAREWDDYFDRYSEQFKLDDRMREKAVEQFRTSKAVYVRWLQGKDPELVRLHLGTLAAELLGHTVGDDYDKGVLLKVKRRAPGGNTPAGDYDEEVTPAERAAELKEKADEVRAAYAKMDHLGRDVEGAALRTKKADVAAIRAELQKEIDDHTNAMKDGLAKLFATRASAYAARADDKDEARTVQAMLTPMKEGNNPLARLWDEYVTFVKDYAPNLNEGQKADIDGQLAAAKVRFDRWLAGQDEYNGKPVPNPPVAEWRKLYADAEARSGALARLLPDPKKAGGKDKAEPAPALPFLPVFLTDAFRRMKSDAETEVKALTTRMQAELKTRSDALRAQVGTPLLGEDRAKGYAPPSDERRFLVVPKSWTPIDYIDWTTRWFLLVVGILLMVGLFTRLSCFSAAVFLLMTILTQPSVPWLPAPPVSEGNYLFVNKNVIEMVALLVLMTTRSGKWAGLDAIVSWVFGRRRRRLTRY